MKNIKLGFLCLIISLNGYSQLTYMPDDAFEQCVEASIVGASTGNSPNDNYVNTAAIQNPQTAWNLGFYPSTVPSGMINDFTGILDFTSLTSVLFQSMNMTSINLGMLSGSVNTLSLSVSFCNNLTSITLPQNKLLLSLESNTMLQNVNFQSNNILNGLNISGNNSLTSIDISNTSGVKPGSWLTIIDNPVLTCLKLNNGQCSNWLNATHTGNGYIDINDPWSEFGGSLFCVQVDNPAYCEISNSWSYGVTGLPNTYYYSTNCTNCAADIDEVEKYTISISPNPTTSKFVVEGMVNMTGTNYYLLDQIGNIIQSGTIDAEKMEIDLSRFAEGVYWLKFENSWLPVQRIIKQ